jgi:thiol-disulfide isomerase/thioredoxin
VQVKFVESVAVYLLLGALLGCATSTKEHPVGPAPATASSPEPAKGPAPDPTLLAAASASGSATPGPAPAAAKTGSAYFGCGEPIPLANLWDETSESQVFEAISAAKACALEHDRRLLLEFVAPWCEDCQEMAKLDETAVVAATLKSRFERVRVNVGKWDRHEGLRKTFDVRALATYIVIDPKTSKELAKTTLEPITKKGQKISAEQWAAWLKAH